MQYAKNIAKLEANRPKRREILTGVPLVYNSGLILCFRYLIRMETGHHFVSVVWNCVSVVWNCVFAGRPATESML
jgi:hypothetical protein